MSKNTLNVCVSQYAHSLQTRTSHPSIEVEKLAKGATELGQGEPISALDNSICLWGADNCNQGAKNILQEGFDGLFHAVQPGGGCDGGLL